jgi:ABC-2 type transport system permease protein
MEATVAEQPGTLAPWHRWREGLRAVRLLGAREIRTSIRMPAYFIPNLLVPLFFYFVMVGSLEEFAGGAGIDYQSFQMPVAILFAVMSGSAGLNMVTDIESGYFDKLLLTPASRLSLLIGAMGADFFRVMAQAALVVVVTFLTGAGIATGLAGAVVMILVASLWGLAFEAIGFAAALKTGNAQTTQSIWVLFLPFMFLTTTFAPEGALSGWLATAATYNPMTYVLRGLRSLTVGWDVSEIGVALLAIAVVGALTIPLAFRALVGRIR